MPLFTRPRNQDLPQSRDASPADIDRRAFAQMTLGGSFALAFGLGWPARLFAEIAPISGGSALGWVQPESTRRMAALLAKITREGDPMKNLFRNTERVALLRAVEAASSDPQQQFKTKIQLAQDLLGAGYPEDSLREHEAIEKIMQDNNVPVDDVVVRELMTSKALCYLRMGENDNCCANHNADSCMFPIHGKGIHTNQRGSRGAVVMLTELLEKFPNDLRARWLLNIAYMTLGEYPAKVPPKWLFDPKLFVSDFDIKHFPDIAGDVGLDQDGLAGGVVLEDFDNDGLLDVMVSSWGVSSNNQLRYFRNNGDGTFTERTEQAGLKGEVGGLNLVTCDYNNDGFVDVLVLRGAWLGNQGRYPASLLRNNGDGTFTDVTEEAGLLRFHPTQTAVWFDYNGDGWVDLFIGNESRDQGANTCELFRNNGDGTFTECAADHGLDVVAFVKGVASADYNNDGRPDLFISRLDGPPLLYRNDGPAGNDTSAKAPWRFTEVSEDAGISEPRMSFPCWFFDYNNDGWPDILVTGYTSPDHPEHGVQSVGDIAAEYLGRPHSGQPARLYRNNGDGTFTDVSKESGLDKLLHAMGCNFGDLDNDGWLDFYLGTGDPGIGTLIPNRMFRNDGGKRFQDVTTSGGFGQLQKGHAISFGDINNSGTQDIYSVVGGAVEGDHYHHQLFSNPGHGNNWIKLKLEGVTTNRAAVGARVKVVVQAEEGERAIHRTVGACSSFGSSPLRLEIGLGQARIIKRVEILWPVTGVTQELTGLDINRMYHVREGESVPKGLELRSFKWPKSASV
jgi:hypothetical protein